MLSALRIQLILAVHATSVDRKCRLPCLITGEGWTKDFEGNQLVCIWLQIYDGSVGNFTKSRVSVIVPLHQMNRAISDGA